MIRSLIFLLALPVVHSGSSADVLCENFTVHGEGTMEEVCAWHIFAIENSPNGTLPEHLQTFHILEPVNRTAGEFPNCGDGNGIIVELAHWLTKGTCDVTINGAPCANCQYCDDSLHYVSVDCSVIPGGRSVECESNDNVFYPFEGYASTNAVTTDDSEESPSSEQQVPTNPPSEGNTTVALESSSYRCTAISISAILVATIGSILQL